MRLGGPTVALLANDSVVAGGAGGGLLGDIPNMPAGAMAAPRLIPPSPSMPRRGNGGGGANIYSSSPGLTLGLPSIVDGRQQAGAGAGDGDAQNQSGIGAPMKLSSKNKDEEYESRSGSDNMDGSGGEDQDNEPPRKKRYHRHTPHQIQEMEALFKECPHPDDKQRQELSRELGLEPRQVKFWFQNRRTQLKAQQERAENSMLRLEIEKLRAENVTMREAIKNASCPSCGGPATLGEMSYDEQQLRIENARLKDELDRVSTLAAKYLGRPIPHLSGGGSQAPSSSLDLAVGGAANFHQGGAAAAGSLVSAGSESMRPGGLSEADKPMIVDLAVTAMEELYRLCQPEEPSWIPSPDGPKEVLNYDEYIRQYQSALGPRPYGMRTEATRESDLVMMNGVNLVELLMDSAKWAEIFPSIVSRAVTIDVLATGVTGNRNGAVQLMYAEMQVLSPLVPTREFYFVRYCKQHADGVWGIVDVSVDALAREAAPSSNRCRRRPSGYLIQDMPNGYSKVTVLEHVEYDDRSVNRIYKPYVNSGLAFGAQRWLLTLQRQCERLASLLATSISARDLGVIPNASGRRSMLKLAQRMTNNFCAGVSASTVHTWTTLSGSGEDDVRVMTRKSVDNPGEPHGIVLSAATSLWLPVPPKRVFEFLRDERLRNEWDILSNGGMVQEMAHIAKGQDPGNSVSLLRVNTLNSTHSNMLILQESCTDDSGSLVVYAPVDIPAMNLVMQGGDPAYVALLPSGFAILPDGQDHCGSLQHDSLEVDRPRVPGSLLTVAFQILVSNVPSAKLSLESVTTVNNLISCTVQKIKAALQCDNQ
ncbi:homeobox-leucine zipper protein HDG2 [Selaginella moellendorffii]|nr:homeobox-leucine zipper protein HDG2 [Selaginella moellendorffii]|eukprot:XP_002979015.2 homeobox-leucine zipper protein HDG2 [Selaginella moellendorffii]